MDKRFRPLKVTAMALLVIASMAGLGVLTVIGLEKAPYVAVPVLVALLVWGLLRSYNALMRQAERAYLESKHARERAQKSTEEKRDMPQDEPDRNGGLR